MQHTSLDKLLNLFYFFSFLHDIELADSFVLIDHLIILFNQFLFLLWHLISLESYNSQLVSIILSYHLKVRFYHYENQILYINAFIVFILNFIKELFVIWDMNFRASCTCDNLLQLSIDKLFILIFYRFFHYTAI